MKGDLLWLLTSCVPASYHNLTYHPHTSTFHRYHGNRTCSTHCNEAVRDGGCEEGVWGGGEGEVGC